MEFLSRLAKYDTFVKSKEHVQVRTFSGAIVSVTSVLIMLLLLVSEFRYYRHLRVDERLVVDTSQGERDVDIEMDIVFHALQCKDLDVRLEDSKGQAYDASTIFISRIPVDEMTAEAAMSAHLPESHLGVDAPACRVVGALKSKKVGGNFHVAAGRPVQQNDGMFAYSFSPADFLHFNASHTIRHLTLGPEYPGQTFPLDATTSPFPKGGLVQYQYHIKVVPTLYERLSGQIIDSHQFSATDFVQVVDPAEGVWIQPGVWFKYDFSPIMVRMVETRHSIFAFLTSVCAILGGVFTISGLVDQLVFRVFSARKNK